MLQKDIGNNQTGPFSAVKMILNYFFLIDLKTMKNEKIKNLGQYCK